jgi:TolA-binding protein
MTKTTGVYDTIGWLDENRGKVIRYGIILVIAGVLVAFFIWQTKQKEILASQAVSEALDPMRIMGLDESGEAPAAQTFLDLATKFSGTPAGARALLFGAGALFEDGKYSEAQARFDEFMRDYAESPMRVQAQLGLASCLEAQGRAEEAGNQYQAVIDRNPGSYVLPQAKFELALLQQSQGNTEEAYKLFQELVRPETGGAYAGSARMRIEALLIEHPSLRQTNAPAGTTVVAPAS